MNNRQKILKEQTMIAHRDLVIGVDAGGTKTTAWIAETSASDDSQQLGKGSAGPGNPRAVGFELAAHQIETAIVAAFAKAELAPGKVAAICFGVAGAGRSLEQRQLQDWAEQKTLAEKIIVTHDAEPILAAAAPDRVGIALISGTGSFAWGRNAAGETARTGGWGHLFGDEGSGYAIAQAGLRAAAKSADGRGPSTQLLDAFLERWQANDPSQLIEKVYAGPLSRDEIARMAEVVFTVAAKGDTVAIQLLDEAVQELKTTVTVLANKLCLTPNEWTLALTGGVLVRQTEFAQKLIESLEITNNHVSIVTEPVAGAVTLARIAGQE